MADRRFPPPWTIDDANAACFIVRDSTGQALGYFYFEEEPGRRAAAKLLPGMRRGGWPRASLNYRASFDVERRGISSSKRL